MQFLRHVVRQRGGGLVWQRGVDVVWQRGVDVVWQRGGGLAWAGASLRRRGAAGMGEKSPKRAFSGMASTTGKKIGTHDGSFHCDEALACFLLKQLPAFQVRQCAGWNAGHAQG
jgi:hypothetical protein